MKRAGTGGVRYCPECISFKKGGPSNMQMKFKQYSKVAFTVILCATLALTGCASGTQVTEQPKTETTPKSEETPKKAGPTVGGTYINTTFADAKILIPALVADNASGEVTNYTFDGLVTWDKAISPQPAVAKSWKIDEDRIYTFTLHDDVKFHDNTPLTADDVLFTYEHFIHPKYQGVRFSNFAKVKGVADLAKHYKAIADDLKAKKIDEKAADAKKMEAYEAWKKLGAMQAVDKHTFRIELTEPYAPAFSLLMGYGIMPKHIYEPHQNDFKASPLASKPVGSGAYKFVEWVKGDRIVLERNPDWKWGIMKHPANIEKVIIKVLPDMQATMVAVETKESDYAVLQPDNKKHFVENVKHAHVYSGQTFSYTYLGYNLKNPMFEDKRVRQAITHAINRQEIVDQILVGEGAVAHGHASPVRWDYNANLPKFDYDVKKAAALLDAAGWTLGTDGTRAKGGKKLAFEIATNSGNKVREQSAVVIQQALKQVGIVVALNYMEWSAFLDRVQSDKKEAYILGWSLGFDPDPTAIFTSKGGFYKMVGYSNPRIDELAEQGLKVSDIEKRKPIYAEVQKILAEDQVYSWLFFSNSIIAINKRIKGNDDKVTPVGYNWNFEDWYIEDTPAK
jgi:peptide/nickel transport system substrate-binding protein